MLNRLIKTFLVILSVLVLTINASGNDKSKLPKILNSSGIGREYYFSFIPTWESPGGAQYGLKIYVISAYKTKVILEVEAKGFIDSIITNPFETHRFELLPNIGQAYSKYYFQPPSADQIYRKAGVHIKSEKPILCYAASRYANTSDAFIVLPVNVIGTDYVVASYTDVVGGESQWHSSYTSITAAYDYTNVKFTMGGNDTSRTAGGQKPGDESFWEMNAGDVLLFGTISRRADLSGSIISADKPVAVVSGNFCAFVPTECGCCDLIEEMELPVNMWGLEYHVPNIYGRKKNSMLKIFAKEPNTKIFRDSINIGLIQSYGGTEGKGFLSIRADSGNARPIVISGDKPISVTQYNTGQVDDRVESDPFQMVLIPTNLYQTKATFITPGKDTTTGYPKNYLTIIYQVNEKDSIPDDLEIAPYTEGYFVWEKLSEISDEPGVPFSQKNVNEKYFCKTIPVAFDGRFKIRANKPFQCYSYGSSWNVTYGLPSFVGFSDLDIYAPDSLAPNYEITYNDCGIIEGFIYDTCDYMGDLAKIASIEIDTNISSNFKLLIDNFSPCADTIVSFRLERIDIQNDALAYLTFSDCNGNDSTISFSYLDSNKIFFEKEIIDFGVLRPNTKQRKEFFVYNKSVSNSIELSQIVFSSTGSMSSNKGYTILDSNGNPSISLPIIIPPMDSIKFYVEFQTNQLGSFVDTLGIGDCIVEYNKILTAESKAPIIQVSDINFGDYEVGQTKKELITISNPGNDNLEIYKIDLPELMGNYKNKKFKIFSSEDIELLNIDFSNPLVILAGTSEIFEIAFKPDLIKNYSDSLVVYSNSITNIFNPDSIGKLDGIGIIGDNIDVDLIEIYPQPADDFVSIKNIPRRCEHITIFDLIGKEIRDIKFINSDGNLTISTKEYAKGYYIMRFFLGSKIVDKTFIISRE